MAVVGTATVEIHAALDAVRTEISNGLRDALTDLNTNIKINVDTAEATAKIDELKAKTGTGALNLNVDADTGAADAKLVATRALADETTKKRTTKVDADTRDAENALVDLGFVLDKLGLQASAFGTGTQLKIGAIAGAIPAVGAAIGSAFAALPALLGGIAAGAGAVMIGFSGIGTVIKGMGPDATAAQLKAMNQQLADMSPQAAGVARELGNMVNGPLADLKKDIQSNLLGPLTGDFNALAAQTLPILNTGMSQIAGTVGVGLHDAIQQVISQGPQLSQMFGGMNTLLHGLTQQAIPSFIGSFINMGAAAAPAMKSVTDGLDSIFTGFQQVIAQQIDMGTFTQAVAGLGPVLRGIGDVFNQLIGVVIQLGAGLSGGLGQALSDIAKLLAPLEPILESVGKVFLQLVDTVAQQLLPIFTKMTPAFENFVNALGQLLIPILQAVGPAVGQLVQGLLQVLTALEPLYGPTSLTAQAMQALGQIFEDVAPLVTALGKVLGEIVDALSKALAPVIPIVVSAIKTLADALIPVADVVGKTAATLIDALAPTLPMIAQSFSDLVTALAPFLPQIAQLAGTLIQNLAPILPIIAKVFADVVNAIIPMLPIMASLLPPLISLANVVLPPLVNLLGFLADHAWIVQAAFAAWAGLKVAETVAGWGTAIQGGLTQLSYLSSTAKDGEGAVSGLAKGFQAFKDIPSSIGPAVSGIKDFAKNSGLASAATKVWTGVQAVFDAVMSANPIALIVIGIAALIAIIILVVTHWKTVTAVVKEVWDALKSFGSWIAGAFTAVWHDMVSGITTAFNSVKNFLVTWGPAILAVLAPFIGIPLLIIQHWQDIVALFQAVWNKIKSVAETVWNAIAGFFTGAFNAFKNFFTTIWDAIASYFERWWNERLKAPAEAVWNAISAFFTTAFNIFKAFFETIWNAISTVFTTVWNAIKATATAVWTVISDFFITAFNIYKAIFETVWNAISLIFTTVWNAIKTVATTVWDAISSFFTAAFDAYKAAFQVVWNIISTIFSTVWNAIKDAATTIWNAISAFFTAAFDVFSTAFSVVWNAISTVFSTVWNTVKSVATTVWGAISGFFTGAFNTFKTDFTNVWNTISGVFTNVWNGIKNTAQNVWDGIKSVFTDSINAVIGFVNSMIHGINKVTGFFLIPGIPDIPRLAAGGTLTLDTVVNTGTGLGVGGTRLLAAGGPMDFAAVGGGFKTSGPKAIVGEGDPRYPEYVIPTDPTHRTRAKNLLSAAAQDMGLAKGGIPMFDGGGVLSSIWGGITGGLSSAWNATTGALGSAWDDVTGWIKTAAASTVHALADGLKKLMPPGLVGQIGDGAIDKIANALISWIGTENAKQAAVAAANPNTAVPASRQANEAAVQAVAAGYGWDSGPQWADLVAVINRESGFNNVAQNPTSTAYGMFQFLDSTWAGYPYGKTSDPHDQAVDGLLYIKNRYTNPTGAWSHEVSAGWYDNGGWLPPGMSLSQNNTGMHELITPINILRDAFSDAFRSWGDDDDDRWQRRMAGWATQYNHSGRSIFMPSAFQSTDPYARGGASAPTPTPTIPQQPTTSTAVTVSTGTGDIGTAFKDALGALAPELSQAISAGAATQIVTSATALLNDPQRMAAINQSVADELGTSVTDMSTRVQDVISSALPTAKAEGGTIDPTMGAAGTLSAAHSSMASSSSTSTSSSPVTIHPGAFQVHVNGNADSVTVAQLQKTLQDWNSELLHQIRGRK